MASTKTKRGFMRKAVEAMIAGRTRQVTNSANASMQMVDTERLRTLGQSKAEMRKRGSAYQPI